MYKQFVDNLLSRLQVEYSLRTNYMSFTGGGAKLFYPELIIRLGEKAIFLQKNSIFANSQSLGELGESIWQQLNQ